MKLGEALKKGRKAKGLTLRQLATMTGQNYALIYKLETGLIYDPGFRRLVKLAKALGLSLDGLAKCE
jgi:transcriptional regulator with XRE-family HTH domain